MDTRAALYHRVSTVDQNPDAAGVRFIALTQGIDLRPGGDAMSRLLLTMLSAVAEFERSLIIERTRLGLDRARRAGKRLGRPPVVTPPADKVKKLRAKGSSWEQVARRLRCSVWAARKSMKNGGRSSVR